jgi:glutamate--cysteine ligase
MIFCLLQESPPIGAGEHSENDHNLIETAHHGRMPGFELLRQGKRIRLSEWSMELFAAMEGVCEVLDGGANGDYRKALEEQRKSVEDPDLTPSSRMLADMRSRGEGFYHFSKFKSQQHHEYFNHLLVDDRVMQEFARSSEQSLHQQQAIEAQEQQPFGQFLEAYFRQ